MRDYRGARALLLCLWTHGHGRAREACPVPLPTMQGQLFDHCSRFRSSKIWRLEDISFSTVDSGGGQIGDLQSEWSGRCGESEGRSISPLLRTISPCFGL